MIELRRQEFIDVLGMTPETFVQRTMKRQFVLAWGAAPGMNAKFYPVDLAVARVVEEAATMTGFYDAANIVATHMDHVLETIGRAEYDSASFYYLAVAAAGHGAKTEYLISSGLPTEILADINGAKPPFPHHRVCTINMTRIIADLRKRGAALRLDLSEPFFLPPDHPKFRELIGGAAELRRLAIATLKRDDPERYAKKMRREPVGRAL
jgi:hypothetical protein